MSQDKVNLIQNHEIKTIMLDAVKQTEIEYPNDSIKTLHYQLEQVDLFHPALTKLSNLHDAASGIRESFKAELVRVIRACTLNGPKAVDSFLNELATMTTVNLKEMLSELALNLSRLPCNPGPDSPAMIKLKQEYRLILYAHFGAQHASPLNFTFRKRMLELEALMEKQRQAESGKPRRVN